MLQPMKTEMVFWACSRFILFKGTFVWECFFVCFGFWFAFCFSFDIVMTPWNVWGSSNWYDLFLVHLFIWVPTFEVCFQTISEKLFFVWRHDNVFLNAARVRLQRGNEKTKAIECFPLCRWMSNSMDEATFWLHFQHECWQAWLWTKFRKLCLSNVKFSFLKFKFELFNVRLWYNLGSDSEKFHFEQFRGLEALRKTVIDVQTYRHFRNKESSSNFKMTKSMRYRLILAKSSDFNVLLQDRQGVHDFKCSSRGR